MVYIRTYASKAIFFETLLRQNGYRCTCAHSDIEIGIFVINPAAKIFEWTPNNISVSSDMTIEDFIDLFL